MYIHICIYTYIRIYVRKNIHVYVHIPVYIFICSMRGGALLTKMLWWGDHGGEGMTCSLVALQPCRLDCARL